MKLSITTKGPVSAVIELIPRTRMVLSFSRITGTPERTGYTGHTRPCNASDTLPVGVFFNASAAFYRNNFTGQVTLTLNVKIYYDNFLQQLTIFCQF